MSYVQWVGLCLCCLGALCLLPGAPACLGLVCSRLLRQIPTVCRWILSRRSAVYTCSEILNELYRLLKPMGRWMQSRRHGSATQGYTVPPPTNADWDAAPADNLVEVTSTNAGPGHGVDSLVIEEYLLSDPGTIVGTFAIPVEGDETGGAAFAETDQVGVRVAWAITLRRVSGWSAQKTVAF